MLSHAESPVFPGMDEVISIWYDACSGLQLCLQLLLSLAFQMRWWCEEQGHLLLRVLLAGLPPHLASNQGLLRERVRTINYGSVSVERLLWCVFVCLFFHIFSLAGFSDGQ